MNANETLNHINSLLENIEKQIEPLDFPVMQKAIIINMLREIQICIVPNDHNSENLHTLINDLNNQIKDLQFRIDNQNA